MFSLHTLIKSDREFGEVSPSGMFYLQSGACSDMSGVILILNGGHAEHANGYGCVSQADFCSCAEFSLSADEQYGYGSLLGNWGCVCACVCVPVLPHIRVGLVLIQGHLMDVELPAKV